MALLSTKPWEHDPEVINLPWRDGEELIFSDRSQNPGPLCFGVLSTDGFVNPHPPVARGMQIAIDAVRQAGHKVLLRRAWLCAKLMHGSVDYQMGASTSRRS